MEKEKEIANKIKDRVAALNQALREAYTAQIRVEITTHNVYEFGKQEPLVIVESKAYRIVDY